MDILLLVPILAPLAAAVLAAGVGWRRLSATVTVLAAVSVLVSGAVIGLHIESGARFGAVRRERNYNSSTDQKCQ